MFGHARGLSVPESTRVYPSVHVRMLDVLECPVQPSVPECTQVYQSAPQCTLVHPSVPECTPVCPSQNAQHEIHTLPTALMLFNKFYFKVPKNNQHGIQTSPQCIASPRNLNYKDLKIQQNENSPKGVFLGWN